MNGSPIEFYREKAFQYQKLADQQAKKYTNLIPVRALIFLGGLAGIFFTFSFGLLEGGIAIIVAFVAFVSFIKYHESINKKKKKYLLFKEINEEEIQRINRNFHTDKNGLQYLDKEHAYLIDLDIFGHGSIFEFIDRTATSGGEARLASWLVAPASENTILKRQEAVKELAAKPDWRQQFRVLEKESDEKPTDVQQLLEWLNEPDQVLGHPFKIALIFILPIITLSLLIGTFFDIPSVVLTFAVMVHFYFLYRENKNITKVHEKTSAKAEVLLKYRDLFKAIEQEKFNAEILKEAQAHFTRNEKSASAYTKKLAKYVSDLDVRYNIFALLTLSLFLFWDLHVILKLERWKRKVRKEMPEWFNAIAEIDALNSFANLYFNNKNWAFPQLVHDKFIISTDELGHFLIPEGKRITNNFSIEGRGEIHLITGSNMAGKSTFLRTLGTNIVLAMAGAPVCAKVFISSPIHLYSSMRNTDSLELNESSFYAELKRLKLILEKVEHDPNSFFLIDEILKGTNSMDRHKGSVAMVHQLLKYNATGLISTHDLELAEEAEKIAHVKNYSFEVQITGEDLVFDYTLREGICRSFNASILMERMGIEMPAS